MLIIIIIVDNDPPNLGVLWRLIAVILIDRRQHGKGVNMIHSIITALTTMKTPRNHFYEVLEV